jgi:hypothetical protein
MEGDQIQVTARHLLPTATLSINSFVWAHEKKHQVRDLGNVYCKFAPQIFKIKPIFYPYEWRELCTDMGLSENRITPKFDGVNMS